MVNYIDKSVERYIKSKKALETLDKVVARIEKLNSDKENPFKIVSVRVGGSVWRKENPLDIDIILFYDFKEEMKNEVSEFQNFLSELDSKKIALLHNLKNEMHWELKNGREVYVKRKIKMAEYIDDNKDVLIDLGFKPRWLEWMKYQKTSEVFPNGIFGIFIRFKPEVYLEMKIKENLKPKIKVGMELFYIHNYDPKMVIPSIVIWDERKSLKITDETYKNHLSEEWNLLLNQFYKIEKVARNPDIIEEIKSYPVRRAFTGEIDKDLEELTSIGAYEKTLEIYHNKYDEYEYTSLKLQQYINKLFEEGYSIIDSNLTLKEKITQLRSVMKKMRIVGDVLDMIFRSRIIWDKVIPNPEFPRDAFKDLISQYVLKHSTDAHTRRDDLKMILKEFDFTIAVDDIREGWKRRREEVPENARMGRV